MGKTCLPGDISHKFEDSTSDAKTAYADIYLIRSNILSMAWSDEDVANIEGAKKV